MAFDLTEKIVMFHDIMYVYDTDVLVFRHDMLHLYIFNFYNI